MHVQTLPTSVPEQQLAALFASPEPAGMHAQAPPMSAAPEQQFAAFPWSGCPDATHGGGAESWAASKACTAPSVTSGAASTDASTGADASDASSVGCVSACSMS